MKKVILISLAALLLLGSGCKKCWKCYLEKSNGSNMTWQEFDPSQNKTGDFYYSTCDKNVKKNSDGSDYLDGDGNKIAEYDCEVDYQ